MLKPVCSTTKTKIEYIDWNFAWSKFDYYTFQTVNNKGADQSSQMCRMVCTFVVCMPKKSDFLGSRPMPYQAQYLFPNR